MDLLPYLIAFIVSYVAIALKAFQTLNVVQANYRWMWPTSILTQMCNVVTIGLITTSILNEKSYWLLAVIVLALSLGSTLGGIHAVMLHKYFSSKKGV